eukprot:1141214-Pelagomonas_calceolata.AAC.3
MLSNPSRTAASTASCTGKPPLVGIVRCSNKSNQFTTSIEELERQLSHLGAGTSGLAQAAAHGVLKHSRSPPTPLVPPLRRPAAPPVDLQGVHAETASVARGASPIQLAQLAQQLRMRVRAVQDLVERCPQTCNKACKWLPQDEEKAQWGPVPKVAFARTSTQSLKSHMQAPAYSP